MHSARGRISIATARRSATVDHNGIAHNSQPSQPHPDSCLGSSRRGCIGLAPTSLDDRTALLAQRAFPWTIAVVRGPYSLDTRDGGFPQDETLLKRSDTHSQKHLRCHENQGPARRRRHRSKKGPQFQEAGVSNGAGQVSRRRCLTSNCCDCESCHVDRFLDELRVVVTSRARRSLGSIFSYSSYLSCRDDLPAGDSSACGLSRAVASAILAGTVLSSLTSP